MLMLVTKLKLLIFVSSIYTVYVGIARTEHLLTLKQSNRNRYSESKEYCKPGSGSTSLRATVCRVRNTYVFSSRVADPVHFRPDPAPANQNFVNRIRILWALTKNQFKHLNFFSHQTFLLMFE